MLVSNKLPLSHPAWPLCYIHLLHGDQNWDKMSGLKQPPPLKMVGKVAQNYEEFIQSFKFYNIASGFSAKPEKDQCALFLHVAGAEAQKVYANMTFTAAETNKIATLIAKFETHCKASLNITVVRYEFNSCNQKQNELFDNYLTRLQSKIKNCNFGELNDELLRDRLVGGVFDEKLRTKLLQTADLDLDKCIQMCRLSEVTPQQLTGVSQVDTVTHTRSNMSQKPRPNRGGRNSHPQRNSNVSSRCGNCGSNHAYGRCPASGQTCHACNKVGHFKSMCRSSSHANRGRRMGRNHGHGQRQRQRRVHEVEIVPDEESETCDGYDSLFVGEVTINSQHKSAWTETISVNGRNIQFKLDTGSEADVIPYSLVKNCNLHQLMTKSSVRLMSFSKHGITPVGQIQANVNGHELVFQIVEGVEPILGRDSCQKLDLIKRVNTISQYMSNDSENIVKEFADVFMGPLGCVQTKTHLEVDPNVDPSVDPPRRIPYALRDPAKAALDEMVDISVLARQYEPTPWVSSMTIVKKPDGSVRICIDPTKLNKALKRPHHPIQTVEEAAARMPDAKLFSILDAIKGFWQMELDYESSLLTTFNTPWGRYRFLRLPFGLNVSSDLFNLAMQQIFGDIEGVKIIVDDILVHGVSTQDHDMALRTVLQRCRESGLKLNRSKTKIALPEVGYVGHVMSSEGLKPSPERVRAVLDMPTPTNTEAVHRFIGLVGYLHKFIPNLSQEAKPLRVLLEKDVQWHWDKPQEDAFQRLKQLVTEAPVLQYYNVKKPVVMQTDASKSGVGAALIQDDHPVAFGSRALDETQSRYAVIEKELLAVCFACKKFHDYIYAKTVTVETDHKPLVSIMEKPLHMLSQRLQQMRMRLLRYDLKLVYRPGKEMHLADTLSRAYLPETTPDDLYDDSVDINIVQLSESLQQKFANATARDPALQCLVDVVMEGWPDESRNAPPEVRPYFMYKELITYRDGILYKGDRIIVPAELRSDILARIHESHQGIVKCKARARDAVYWPGINAQIEDMVSTCAQCQENRKSQPSEPMIPHDIPDRPWAKVGTDLVHYKNNDYMLCVDYYSKYPEMSKLNDQSSASTINALKSMFARHGLPDEVMSDNGPQYSSHEFAQFADQWEFKHTTISPGYSQSNGQVERTVQTIKDMFRKLEDEDGDPYLALLNYRNTPLDGVGKSPAQLLMSRRLKTRLPQKSTLLKPEVAKSVHSKLVQRQKTQKFYYDQKAGTPKPELKEGDIVRFRCPKGTWRLGVVRCKRTDAPRSYDVATAEDKVYRRNRQHIFRTREPQLVARDQPVAKPMMAGTRAAPSAVKPASAAAPTHTGEKPVSHSPVKPAANLQHPSIAHTGEKSLSSPSKPAVQLQHSNDMRHRTGEKNTSQMQCPRTPGSAVKPSKPAQSPLQQSVSVPTPSSVSVSTPKPRCESQIARRQSVNGNSNVKSPAKPVTVTRSGRVSKPAPRLDL